MTLRNNVDPAWGQCVVFAIITFSCDFLKMLENVLFLLESEIYFKYN